MPLDGRAPDWLHLADDESVVWQSRPHPVDMGTRLPIGIGLVLLGFAVVGWSQTDGGPGLLAWAGLLVSLAGAIVLGIEFLHWTHTRYVITTNELYEKRGWISRDVTQFRLDRIQNTSMRQTMAGRALGYGDLTVYTAGSGDPELTFQRVPRPGVASAALSEQFDAVSREEETGRP